MNKFLFKIFVFSQVVFTFLVNTDNLYSQPNTVETIFQSSSDNSDSTAPFYSDGYIYFWKYEEGLRTVYRIFDGNVESIILSNEEENCRSIFGEHYYQDQAYFYYSTTNNCRIGENYAWGETGLVEDTRNLGWICTGNDNFMFVRDAFTGNASVFDITTNTSVPLNLDNDQFVYTLSNICSLNETYVKYKAFKIDKNTNEWVADAIVLYNWRTHEFKEIFSSSSNLFLNDRLNQDGSKITFVEDIHTLGINKLYYYDGQNVLFIDEPDPTISATPYLDGVAYINNQLQLYYWANGTKTLLSTDAIGLAVDSNILAWESSTGGNSTLHFYNGTDFSQIPFSGFVQPFTLTLFNGTSFLIAKPNQDG